MWVEKSREELSAEAAGTERPRGLTRPALMAAALSGGVLLLHALGFRGRHAPTATAADPRQAFLGTAWLAPLLFAGTFVWLWRRGGRIAPDPGDTFMCLACQEPVAESGTCACGGERLPTSRLKWLEPGEARSEDAAVPRPPSARLAPSQGWRVAAIVVVAVLSSATLLWATRWRRPSSVPRSGGIVTITKEDDADTKARKLAEEAVMAGWERHGIVLDHGPDSVQQVEGILAALAPAVAARELTEADTRSWAFVYGAYVGEVIRREMGGAWAEDHAVAGPGSFPLRWGKRESFPVTWCYKRLTGGPDENVWRKYEYFVHGRKLPGVEYETTTTHTTTGERETAVEKSP